MTSSRSIRRLAWALCGLAVIGAAARFVSWATHLSRKYDAQQVLAQFALTTRDETDLDALTGERARVVQETLQPERVSVWLKPVNGERPFP